MNGKLKGLLGSLAGLVVAMLGVWSGYVYAELRSARQRTERNGNRITAAETQIESLNATLERMEGKLDRLIERGR